MFLLFLQAFSVCYMVWHICNIPARLPFQQFPVFRPLFAIFSVTFFGGLCKGLKQILAEQTLQKYQQINLSRTLTGLTWHMRNRHARCKKTADKK